jgi:hypothetical protein
MSEAAQKQTGGCHCGAARFAFNASPTATFYCHCSDCQRTTGSPFSVELMVPSGGFEVMGKLATYTVTGDSGSAVHRRSCARCASGLFLECDADPGFVFLKAGALDDARGVEPEMHIFVSAKQPWVRIADDLPQFERMPPVEGSADAVE